MARGRDVHLHLEAPGETVWAVVAGAVLATIGGFIATQLEAAMHRRERQRNAALMFGEILSAMETLIQIARQSQSRGDPYGPITLRLLKAGQRETETYEKHRSTLYDLHDAEVRIRIHAMMVQINGTLQGVADSSALIADADAALDDPHLSEERATVIQRRRQDWIVERQRAFSYILEVADEIKALVAILQPIAKVDFGELKRFSGNPYEDA